MRNIKHGDVEWYLPNKKRPFAYSTTATSDLIKILYDDLQDLRLVYNAINFDDEAKKIVKTYLDNNIYSIRLR